MLRKSTLMLLLLASLSSGCSGRNEAKTVAAGEAQKQESAQVARHDLSVDEERGGHTLKKHVGKSDDELRERLGREGNIAAASTYTDRETAEIAVAQALRNEADRVQSWAARGGRRPNLVVDYRGDAARPVGRSMRRGDTTAQPCSNAVVVLRADKDSYFVLTSYPECR